MTTILNDTTKFLDLGPVTNKDNTAKIESRIQRRLLQLRKEYLISKQVYEAIRPTGSQRPRIYGIPKIHKTDVPLRPILSMVCCRFCLSQGRSSFSLFAFEATFIKSLNPLLCKQKEFVYSLKIS